MIAREVRAVRELSGLEHIELTALPAAWHFEPQRIAAGVERAVAEARADGVDEIFVGYADCGTGGQLERACRRLGVAMLPGPHCFAVYQGLETARAFEDRDLRSFYVTDFLARQPDAFLWRPLGLDRHPELVEQYFGAYERVVYLAQSEDERLLTSARAIADRLGLTFELRRTGYGELTELLSRWADSSPLARTNGAT